MKKHKFIDLTLERIAEECLVVANKLLNSIADTNVQGEELTHLRSSRKAYLDMYDWLVEEDKRIAQD